MKKRKRKASNLWGIAAVILLIGSISLLLYPTVSKVLNQQKANHVIEEFNKVTEIVNNQSYISEKDKEESERSNSHKNDEQTDYIVNNSDYSISPEDVKSLCRDSLAYNNALKKLQSFDEIDFSAAALNLSDYGIYNGVYGYLSIPEINLQMPILLGATDWNMSVGVTHLYQTSLPIGGKDTNCVLAGHTGFTGRTFFDDIPSLQIGSLINVTTLFGRTEYVVSEIKKIEITETNDLFIKKGKDKLTLLTCADGGVKRWQVSCDRI